MIPIVYQAYKHLDKCAVISNHTCYSYSDLLRRSEAIAGWLLDGRPDLHEERICFLVRPSFLYVVVQWAIWRAGGIAVPLCIDHPPASLKYVMDHSRASMLLSESEPESEWLGELGHPVVVIPSHLEPSVISLPEIGLEGRAMILYTSGTTSKPKGVVFMHKQISSQVACLVKAWQWESSDRILNVLPLHHVHGIINVLSCALWIGATVEFMTKFKVDQIWRKFSEGDVNVFMAVPTVYHKLIQHWREQDEETRERWSASLRRFRLMVSGSAALPVAVLEQWQKISGHVLLERYGMTEIGMAISNPYVGWRRPGHVGIALEEVEIRLMGEQGVIGLPGVPGEIQVRGPGVFEEYWDNPAATMQSFTGDGWFKTGDIAQINDGYYQILGRDSVDIIKSGGYKISALEVEEVLRQHPSIHDCAVVGIPDEAWGEIIAAALVAPGLALDQKKMSEWLKSFLPAYKVPRQFKLIDELPRNAMGKVTKAAVVTMFT